MDYFKNKDIKPMLLHISKPFSHEDYIYEIKFDGIRCIAYLENNKVTLKSRNNKDLTNSFIELQDIYKCSKEKCILDGEIIVLENDLASFSKVHKRVMLTDIKKQKKEINLNPAYFVAFDILFYKNKDLTNYPLIKRKKFLESYIKDSNNLVKSKYIEKEGKKLFESVKEKKMEGIVAKEKMSIYEIGSRSRSWLKIKAVNEQDYFVAGIKLENNKVKSLVLVSYNNNLITYHGDVNLPNPKDQEYVLKYAKSNKVKTPYLKKDNVVWLKLKLKCSVRYLEITSNNHLRHPVFLKFVD